MEKTSSIKTGMGLLLAALLVSTSCNNNSTQSKELPKLSDSARLAQKHIDSLRRASYRNNDLSIIFLDATSQIMEAQMALEKAHAAGNKPGIVDSLIVNSNQGDSMYYALRRMYMAATAFAENDAERAKFNSYTMPDSSKLWLQKYFKGLTPEAALNSLSKFQNDCAVINKIVRR
jgi:hypothetical protein